MTCSRAPWLLLPVALLLGIAGPHAAACDSDGDVQFVCGPVSPEDLIPVPRSPWVVVSSMEDEGHLYLVDTRNHTASVLFTSDGSNRRHDTAVYGSCPGPVSRQFRPHGLSIRPGDGDSHTLYVVGHGTRESVEVFRLDTAGASPTATWVGCVVAPESANLNSVTALPDGGFAATNFNRPMGEVWEWQPATGWSKVPGSEMSGPNGLLVSEDGRWFYIGGHTDESVIRLSRGQTPVRKDEVGVGFQVDNLRWAPDGSVLAAGQAASGPATVFDCVRQGDCDGLTSRVARVDPQALTAEEIVSYPSNEFVILGTGAIQVGEEIWLGAVGGGNRIARFTIQ